MISLRGAMYLLTFRNHFAVQELISSSGSRARMYHERWSPKEVNVNGIKGVNHQKVNDQTNERKWG